MQPIDSTDSSAKLARAGRESRDYFTADRMDGEQQVASGSGRASAGGACETFKVVGRSRRQQISISSHTTNGICKRREEKHGKQSSFPPTVSLSVDKRSCIEIELVLKQTPWGVSQKSSILSARQTKQLVRVALRCIADQRDGTRRDETRRDETRQN